ncbi:MAG: ribosome recycling factor, partial [Nitrospirota bacterium]
ASHMTEDEAKKSHDEIQKLTDTYILKVDEIVKKKEAEITEI